MTNGLPYRRDIDGLRAVAVLPVLLFHAGVGGFAGGYVGVDIFFVISGYLITGIIAREIGEGRFSILDFYERRARRILPALIPMILLSLAAAAWLYLPGDFESVPRSALAAMLFVSNVGFFLETGYFQGGVETKPLLHSWSLAIEEQFYIGFPILLLIARHAPRRRLAIVGLVALLSFALAVATQDKGDSFAFYLLPPRAWELLAGALLALGLVPPIRSARLREAIAALGLIAIAFAVTSYNSRTVFPGLTALPPVLGGMALIHCAPGTRIGRLLSLRPLVAVGLISYSLYLWHWPLIVFTEYALDAPLAGLPRITVIAASFALAFLSWRYVETPFRKGALFPRRRIFAFAGGTIAATGAIALAMVAAGPWTTRFRPEVVALAQARHDVSPHRDRCHDASSAGRPPCILGADAPPQALLWGDSHGIEFAHVLADMLESAGGSLFLRTQSSCPPVASYSPAHDPRCGRANRETMAQILADAELRTIYLAGFWASPVYAAPAVMEGLDRTIGTLVDNGRMVVLIGPIPSAGFDVPRRLARLAHLDRLDTDLDLDRTAIADATARMKEIADRWADKGVSFIDPTEGWCTADRCALVHEGAPLYFDSHHPSLTGARIMLGQLLSESAAQAQPAD